MYKASEFTKDFYKLNEVSELLNVTPQTLHNYEKRGDIVFQRTEGGHRFLEKQELLRYLRERDLLEDDIKHDIVYIGSIAFDDEDDDYDNDLSVIMDKYDSEMYCPEIIKGSNSIKIISLIMENKVRTIYTRYRKLLPDMIVDYCEKYGVDIKACDETSDRYQIIADVLKKSKDSVDYSSVDEKLDAVSNVKVQDDIQTKDKKDVSLSEKLQLINDFDLNLDRYSNGGIALIADFMYQCAWHNLLNQTIENPAAKFSNRAKNGYYNDMSDDEYNDALNKVRAKSRLWKDKQNLTVWELIENAFKYCSKQNAIKIIEQLLKRMIYTHDWAVDDNVCEDIFS